MSGDPLFSVLCTNYNNGAFIPDMVNSLLSQSYLKWELVFVDDGSRDNSLEAIEPYRSDPRVRVFALAENIGAGGAAVVAAKEAKGTIMGRLDADDALTPNAIDIMVRAHKKHPKASLITSQVIACDTQLQRVTPPWHQNTRLPEGTSILEHPTIGHFATFKASHIKQTDGFNPQLRRAVDLDLYVKLEEVGDVVVLEDQLYRYRQNENGISQGSNGTLAKALAYKVMIDGYFRRKSSGLEPNLTRAAARAMRLRQHQIDIAQQLPLLEPWKSLFSAGDDISRADVSSNNVAKHHFRHIAQPSTSPALIYHVTYKNMGGINTYIQNLSTGSPNEHCIFEVVAGTEATVISNITSKITPEDSLIIHDPTFCRHLPRTTTCIIIVLHGDNPFYYSAVEEFGQLSDGIVGVSALMKDIIPKRFHNKFLTLGPTIPLTSSTSTSAYKKGYLKLIFIAREDKNKGVHHLPSIDSVIIQNGIQAKWTIVLGSRPEKIPEFRNWTKQQSSRVTVFEGIPNNRITELIGNHDSLVLPSASEGHPMVLIEALSQSVPPFTFFYSTDCNNHLPIDPEGIVGPSSDARELAHRIIRHHHRSKPTLSDWQNSARAFIKENHNPIRQSQTLSSFIESLPRTQKSPQKQLYYKWKRRLLILFSRW